MKLSMHCFKPLKPINICILVLRSSRATHQYVKLVKKYLKLKRYFQRKKGFVIPNIFCLTSVRNFLSFSRYLETTCLGWPRRTLVGLLNEKKRKMHIIETFTFNNNFQNIACFLNVRGQNSPFWPKNL